LEYVDGRRLRPRRLPASIEKRTFVELGHFVRDREKRDAETWDPVVLSRRRPAYVSPRVRSATSA